MKLTLMWLLKWLVCIAPPLFLARLIGDMPAYLAFSIAWGVFCGVMVWPWIDRTVK